MLPPRETAEELRVAAEELRVAVLVLRDTVFVRLLVTVERDELPLMPRTVEVVPRALKSVDRETPFDPRVLIVVRLLPKEVPPVRPLRVVVPLAVPRPVIPVIAYPRPLVRPRRVLLVQLG